MKIRHYNKLRALAVTLAVVLAAGTLRAGEGTLLSNGLSAVLGGLFGISAQAADAADKPSREEALRENRRLYAENRRLKSELAEYYDAVAENKRLWELFGLKKEHPSVAMLPSEVIRRDANDDYAAFVLSVGTSAGVSVGDPVVSANGLVGRVSQADGLTCRVTTVFSPDIGVGAKDMQSGDSGVVSGSASLFERGLTAFGMLTSDNRVKEGDLIYTSGDGGVFPPNLFLGKVSEVVGGAEPEALIEPCEDIAALKYAAVITDFSGKGALSRVG